MNVRTLFTICLFALAACTPTINSESKPTLIQTTNPEGLGKASRETLLQVRPGVSTLQDLYALVGRPDAQKDLPNGIALRYPSELGKLPHVVVVDASTGTVAAVALYNHNNAFFSMADLKQQYGEPVLADTINSRDHLFFAGDGMAVIVGHTDYNDLWYVQRLSDDMTLDEYRAHEGYWQETFAFTP